MPCTPLVFFSERLDRSEWSSNAGAIVTVALGCFLDCPLLEAGRDGAELFDEPASWSSMTDPSPGELSLMCFWKSELRREYPRDRLEGDMGDIPDLFPAVLRDLGLKGDSTGPCPGTLDDPAVALLPLVSIERPGGLARLWERDPRPGAALSSEPSRPRLSVPVLEAGILSTSVENLTRGSWPPLEPGWGENVVAASTLVEVDAVLSSWLPAGIRLPSSTV